MSAEMSDREAQKLFNEVSSALKGNDTSKLDELLIVQDTPNDDQLPETPVEEIVEEVVETTPLEEAETPVVEEVVTPSVNDEKPDELADLRAQLAKVSKENHSLRSQAGRVPHVQRKLKELDDKLEELNKRAASPSSHPNATIQPKVLEALKGIEDTDPELAKTIAAAIAAATTGVAEDYTSRERSTLETLRAQEFATYQAQEVDRLLEMYPNAPEVFKSPSWKDWKKDQSQIVQQLASSDNADDVARAFKFYADDMVAKHPELATTATATAVVPADNAEKAAQIEEERKRKQAASTNVRTPNAAGKVSMPDDPEALFKKYSEQIRKERLGN